MFERIFGSNQGSTLIQSAFDDISSMLHQGQKMMEIALRSLLGNEPLEVNLDQMDDQLDNSERMVRRTVLQHLTVNPQQDLVASLVLASMVQDAERIGDFANGLAELSKLAGEPRSGPFAERLRAIALRLTPQFSKCEQAFRDDDPEGATAIMEVHSELRAELVSFVVDVAASGMSSDMAVVYSGGAAMLRRISAHLANIATSVVMPYDQIRHGDEDA